VSEQAGLSDDDITLRTFRESDLEFLDRLVTDPEALGYFEWPGFIDARTRRRRWEQDGYVGDDTTALAVVLPDGTVAGLVSWERVQLGNRDMGLCLRIGAALLPEHRGRGIGTRAQRRLVEHLHEYTVVHRLEAITDAENLAEQKSLERVGFQREGVMREITFQHGRWRDAVLYELLRVGP
jgi:ribosomal-protein-alanine N-acetyltransferase